MLRKRKEDEIKQQLGKKNFEILTAKEELAALTSALTDLQASEKQKRSAATSVMELRYSVAYRFKLKHDIAEKCRRIDDLNAQAAEIRKMLVKAKQRRRAIEIVRERQYGTWQKAYRSQQQKFIDDVSQQGFIRQKRSVAASMNR